MRETERISFQHLKTCSTTEIHPNYGLTSCSFNNITMEQHPDTFEGHSDDLSIVQGLLGRPKIQRKESSFSGTPPHQQHLGTSKCPNDSLDPNNANQRRRLQSSNTWTTSSGEILSDQDEIEDRDSFLLEYNRLARKV